MKPTPEDIALAEQVGEYGFVGERAEIIAAHTAPLRELAEIGRLAVESERMMQAYRASRGRMDLSHDPQAALEQATRAYLAQQPKDTA